MFTKELTFLHKLEMEIFSSWALVLLQGRALTTAHGSFVPAHSTWD